MKHLKISSLTVFAILAAFTYGCALYKQYGKMAPSAEVTRSFEQYRIDPGLNYYISGSSSYPNAILGLKKSFVLDSDLWKKIEMTPVDMETLVYNMQQRAIGFSGTLQGFVIFDEKGRQLGIWYSLWDVYSFVKMKDEKTVIINTPPIDTYTRHENGDNKDDKIAE